MRRFALSGPALIGLILLLPGCQGVGQFWSDTFTGWGVNPNAPLGDSETLRRVRARPVEVAPLLPEPGNIWPSTASPDPSLLDIQRQTNQGVSGTSNPAGSAPPSGTMRVPNAPERLLPRRGSSSPPGSNQPGLPPEIQLPPLPPAPAPAAPGAAPGSTPAPSGQILQTPQGPAVVTGPPGASGTRNVTMPGRGGQGLLVPNGNGTSTLIGPDGSVSTVPAPR